MSDLNKVEAAIATFEQKSLGEVKVLMVEDDPFLSEMVLTKLSAEGCIPYSTADGSEALGLIEQFRPHVVLLDLMLPGMSGEEILQQLKTNPELKDIPVVIFSNKSEEEGIRESLNNGAARYLVKSATDIQKLPGILAEVVAESKKI
ncbi:response regulator [Patescibacteria group bacterium]|nr:response regulator [Patescibacteria group bacterium]